MLHPAWIFGIFWECNEYMSTAIEFSHVSKQYRLGLVSTKTLSHDIRRFWITNVLGKEDPYLKIGETNDRASKGTSEYKNRKVIFFMPKALPSFLRVECNATFFLKVMQ